MLWIQLTLIKSELIDVSVHFYLMSLKEENKKITDLKKSLKECVDNLAMYIKDYIKSPNTQPQLKSIIMTRTIDIHLFLNDLVAIALNAEKNKAQNPPARKADEQVLQFFPFPKPKEEEESKEKSKEEEDKKD